MVVVLAVLVESRNVRPSAAPLVNCTRYGDTGLESCPAVHPALAFVIVVALTPVRVPLICPVAVGVPSSGSDRKVFVLAVPVPAETVVVRLCCEPGPVFSDTARVKVWFALPAELVAVIVKEVDPAVVAVPEMSPVVELILNHDGNPGAV